METSWLGGRVPLPDLEEMIEARSQPVPKPMGPNARFGYPLRGGFQALMDGFLPHSEGPLLLNTRVVWLSPRSTTRSRSRTAGNPLRAPDQHDAAAGADPAIGEEAPRTIRAAAAALRHVSVRCVHIGVGRENLTEKHWIYYPEDTVFHRIFVQGNASPHCNPPGGFGLTCEITYSPHKPLPCDGEDLDPTLHSTIAAKWVSLAPKIRSGRATQCDLPYAYVVYDHGRAAVGRSAMARRHGSSSPAATASGSITTRTTRSSPGRR